MYFFFFLGSVLTIISASIYQLIEVWKDIYTIAYYCKVGPTHTFDVKVYIKPFFVLNAVGRVQTTGLFFIAVCVLAGAIQPDYWYWWPLSVVQKVIWNPKLLSQEQEVLENL